MPDKKMREELEKAFRESKPVSANDCTGLVQGGAADNEVADNYAKMYNIAPPSNNDNDISIGPDTGGDNKGKGKKVIEP